MPAAEKSSLECHNIDKLGILAGGGHLPGRLVDACLHQGIEPFIVAFKGQTDPALLALGQRHIVTRLGAAGHVIDTLKAHDIRNLVLIGPVRRPSLSELRPDWRAARFFTRVGVKALGDDGLLGALRAELESEGFRIHGIHKFVNDLLAPEGALGRYKPQKGDMPDIERGLRVSQVMGELDIGQAVVVQQGIVLGVEGIEGTDELIARCAAYQRKGRGAILVKTCKPGQDRDLDLPTIGPDTVLACARQGFSGIVIHAGHSLLLDNDHCAALADELGLFISGMKVPDSIKTDQYDRK